MGSFQPMDELRNYRRRFARQDGNTALVREFISVVGCR